MGRANGAPRAVRRALAVGHGNERRLACTVQLNVYSPLGPVVITVC